MPALDAVLTRPFCNHQIEFQIELTGPIAKPADPQTIIVAIKNIGSVDCEMFSLPSISFKDKNSHILPITDRRQYDAGDLAKGRQNPSSFFGRGFPIPLIIIPPNAIATANLNWNSDFKGGNCYDVRSVSFNYYRSEGSETPKNNDIPLQAKVCSLSAKWGVYSTSYFKLTPPP